MKATLCLVLLLLAVSGGGCATIATGKYQDVPITSEPMGAKVRSDTGASIVTPGRMLLQRNRTHTLVAEYPGYEQQQLQLKNKVQGWFWGNILIGGIIGGVVDIASGACDELVPKEVHFDFTAGGRAIANRRNLYLQSHPDTKDEIRFAILGGMAAKGMTREELIASLDQPDTINNMDNQEEFVYNSHNPQHYYFRDGVLQDTK